MLYPLMDRKNTYNKTEKRKLRRLRDRKDLIRQISTASQHKRTPLTLNILEVPDCAINSSPHTP